MISDLSKIKKVFLLGIGGIGVSALARMFKEAGAEVRGSDSSSSFITEELQKIGIEVYEGQNLEHIPGDTDLVVYTVAIRDFASDFLESVKQKFPNTLSYPEVLGLISREKFTIAVSGTHGKTTTTAMTAEIMIEGKFEPTVVVGSLLSKYKSNYVGGSGKYFLVEACEYEKSFLQISPKIAVVTNIDNDHLDFYGSYENIVKTFGEFLMSVPEDGYIVCDPDGKGVKEALEGVKAKVVDYKKYFDPHLALQVFGVHNRKNAAAALAVAEILGISAEDAKKSLFGFTGTWRRFEYKGNTPEGSKVVSDYAHHPTEIKATIEAAIEAVGGKKVFVIFEPHLYSRTKLLLSEFAESFAGAEKTVILPIYPAREVFDGSITSQMVVEKAGSEAVTYEDSPQSAVDYITRFAGEGDIILTLGAGKIESLYKLLVV